jgi:hypothetical protein
MQLNILEHSKRSELDIYFVAFFIKGKFELMINWEAQSLD